MANPHFEGLKGSFTLSKGEAAHLGPQEYRKTAPIQAVQINEDFTVNSEEGTLHAEAGDWLAEGPAGELWSIKEDIFAATYVPVDLCDFVPVDEALDTEVDVSYCGLTFKSVAQQEAKLAAYNALKKQNLPIPQDLKDEIEGEDKEVE